MIIVTAKYCSVPGMRDKVLEIAQPCVDGSRAEEGNYDYTLYKSIENADEILCFEKWESMEILQKHSQMPHYKAFGEARKDLVVKETFKLDIYEIKDKE